MIAENDWTFWEFVFFSAVVFVVAAIDFVLQFWLELLVLGLMTAFVYFVLNKRSEGPDR